MLTWQPLTAWDASDLSSNQCKQKCQAEASYGFAPKYIRMTL